MSIASRKFLGQQAQAAAALVRANRKIRKVTVSARVSQDTIVEINALSAAMGLSISEILNLALHTLFASFTPAPTKPPSLPDVQFGPSIGVSDITSAQFK